ncbi:uncharacterized protein YALI1_B24714g [Yarrowia lipolytica]|uniref:Uncharacterized protein n=1 Tax=Yarrowia lipolytica TaxID=4952 RepID=A0A1D8N8F3_YARLL|nr:hypothetical protein YALI1_B24714g [Yarrowia lipolytica]
MSSILSNGILSHSRNIDLRVQILFRAASVADIQLCTVHTYLSCIPTHTRRPTSQLFHLNPRSIHRNTSPRRTNSVCLIITVHPACANGVHESTVCNKKVFIFFLIYYVLLHLFLCSIRSSNCLFIFHFVNIVRTVYQAHLNFLLANLTMYFLLKQSTQKLLLPSKPPNSDNHFDTPKYQHTRAGVASP